MSSIQASQVIVNWKGRGLGTGMVGLAQPYAATQNCQNPLSEPYIMYLKQKSSKHLQKMYIEND